MSYKTGLRSPLRNHLNGVYSPLTYRELLLHS